MEGVVPEFGEDLPPCPRWFGRVNLHAETNANSCNNRVRYRNLWRKDSR